MAIEVCVSHLERRRPSISNTLTHSRVLQDGVGYQDQQGHRPDLLELGKPRSFGRPSASHPLLVAEIDKRAAITPHDAVGRVVPLAISDRAPSKVPTRQVGRWAAYQSLADEYAPVSGQQGHVDDEEQTNSSSDQSSHPSSTNVSTCPPGSDRALEMP